MQKSPADFAAFIGIDWADKKHDVCLSLPGADQRERSVLEHRPAAIRAWADQLRQRFAGAPIAVALELSQGPIVSALLEHDFFVLFPVQPTTLARYRSAFKPCRAKDDPTDAELALELLLRHRDKLSRLEPESAPMRTLRRMFEDRRGLVDDRVRITNRLIAALKAYFPQVVGWFRDKETAVFSDFVERMADARTRPAGPQRHPRRLLSVPQRPLRNHHSASHRRHPLRTAPDRRRGHPSAPSLASRSPLEPLPQP